jgi:natural product precursor
MKKTRKLSLHKETLRALDPETLAEVAGGTNLTIPCQFSASCATACGGCAGTNNSCRICYEN